MPTLAEMDLDALIAALVPVLAGELMKLTKTEMEPLIDGIMAKRMDAAMPAEDLKAKADAEKARADAAEAKLSAIEATARKARAATLTTASFIPQAWLTFKTKDVSGISLGMYSVFTTGVAAWLVYGLVLGAWPGVVANAVTLALASGILVMKLRYR